ncbi:hypothetical protein HU200_041995 [Digitaria exilis]|uniref:Uncharacterized protein n=1 Tax=Digitaria exilis TaxID=1010633 RepID=A0A835EG65_9POAL|nr:hypothetical protein HU200_041995 [Digitaria exilis]
MEILLPEEVAWATGLEGTARQMAREMGELAADIRRGVAVLALRPGEEAAVEGLERQAALADARRADAVALVAATRRLQEKDLRRLAAAEHLVDPAWLVVVKGMAEYLDSALGDGHAPTPEEVALVVVMEGRVKGADGSMARLAERLRRGAVEFFAARSGEEALVGALQSQAAKADAVRATAEAFMDSLRRFQDAGSSETAKVTTGADNECEDMIL